MRENSNVAIKATKLTWTERVREAITTQQSILCVGLDPIYEKLPAEYKTGDVSWDIFSYNRRIIDGAAACAAAFKPQYKCYSAEGQPGIAALRLTCDYVKQQYPHIPIILDAKYADIGHVLERCAHEAFDLFGVDAVTAMPSPGRHALTPLTSRAGRGCFMVVRTSNPGAEELQDLPMPSGEPLYIEITRRIAGGWNEAGNVGLVAPATEPQVLAEVRAAAPHLPILCPGVGAQGGEVEAAVHAGLDADGAGLLINVSRAIMEAPDPGEAARRWRDQMEGARQGSGARGMSVSGGRSRIGGQEARIREVVVEMFRIGAIRFEPVTLKSGLVSPYYNNLRLLASYPQLLRNTSRLLAETMKEADVEPDVLIGIAEAGIPLAVGLSQHAGIPAGYVRSAAKAHGIKSMVEGAWKEGAMAVLVDDVVSDGASKLEVLVHLQEAGLQVRDIVVLVDRGQGGPEMMARHGLRCHAAVTMEHVLDILLAEGLITEQHVEESVRFMAAARSQG
ncbi:MAG TPA: orotidine-5'-phosphate decarboxylase [Chloroflexia bacterium]|jgi:uridine monophosphate synthetase